MTRAEMETTFRFAPDEAIVSIFTAYPPTVTKLERAGYRPVKVSTQDEKPVGWFYKVPLKEFRWRVGKQRPLSPEALARLQARGAALARRRPATGSTNPEEGPVA
jgi:hypothetical protein